MRCATTTLTRPKIDPEMVRLSTAFARVPMWALRAVEGGVEARLWTSRPTPEATEFVLTGKTKDEIEDFLFGMVSDHWRWVARSPEDDPSVLGVWV